MTLPGWRWRRRQPCIVAIRRGGATTITWRAQHLNRNGVGASDYAPIVCDVMEANGRVSALISDWGGCGASCADPANCGQLGGSPGLAASGEYPARFSRICGHTLHPEC